MRKIVIYFCLFSLVILACAEESENDPSQYQSSEQINGSELAKSVSVDVYDIVDSILPQGASEDFTDETVNGLVTGYAIYSGEYIFSILDPMTVIQYWNNFNITFYNNSNNSDLTILSGELEVDGSVTSSTFPSESITITGSIVIKGVYNNVDIVDTISLDVTYIFVTVPGFNSGSTLTNSIQTFDVSGEIM